MKRIAPLTIGVLALILMSSTLSEINGTQKDDNNAYTTTRDNVDIDTDETDGNLVVAHNNLEFVTCEACHSSHQNGPIIIYVGTGKSARKLINVSTIAEYFGPNDVFGQDYNLYYSYVTEEGILHQAIKTKVVDAEGRTENDDEVVEITDLPDRNTLTLVSNLCQTGSEESAANNDLIPYEISEENTSTASDQNQMDWISLLKSNGVNLSFTLNEDNSAVVSIYNLNGQPVFHHEFGKLTKGEQSVDFNFDNTLSYGVYIIHLQIGDESFSRKVMINQ